MIVTVTARHMTLTPAMKEFAEQKAGKLTKYYDRIQEIEVVFETQKDSIHVEILVNVENNHEFIGNATDADAYAAVDQCVHKLERQLSDHKEKWRNRKHPG